MTPFDSPPAWLRSLLLLICAGVAQAGTVTQHFPANKPPAAMQTQWRIVWDIVKHAGGSEVLVIKEAYFTREPNTPEIKVLGDSRLVEIFVPYNDGERIYDISTEHFVLVGLRKADLGPPCVTPGTIYKRDGTEADFGLVAKEVHDDQLRWMNNLNVVRRGQSLALWSGFDAGNYRYLILYQFRDDGQIGFRLGATAHNLRSSADDSATHVHTACWRIEPELDDATALQISKVSFSTQQVKTRIDPLVTEARIKWEPEEFTRLRIESTKFKNRHLPANNPIGYELLPMRSGSGRNLFPGEGFTLYDFWVTRGNPLEIRFNDLPTYENGEVLAGGKPVLWHHASLMHVPRDEDFPEKNYDKWDGVALTSWVGFDLKPRNFFSRTPLYP